MNDLYRACPRCGETDVRSLGENVCGYCGCLFKISSRGRSTAASRISTLEAELKRIYADKQAWANICLSEENDRLIDRISTLEAENKRLREALRPFAEFPSRGVYGGPLCSARGIYEDGTDEDTARHRGWLDPKDFARARDALQPNTAEDGAR